MPPAPVSELETALASQSAPQSGASRRRRSRLRRSLSSLRRGLNDFQTTFKHRGWRGMLANIPADVKNLSRRATRRMSATLMGWDRKRRQEQAAVRFWCHTVPPHVTPVVVLVNRESGGLMGGRLLAMFRRLLHPLQVGDLADGGPKPTLMRFAACPRLRILCCGGVRTAAPGRPHANPLTHTCPRAPLCRTAPLRGSCP